MIIICVMPRRYYIMLYTDGAQILCTTILCTVQLFYTRAAFIPTAVSGQALKTGLSTSPKRQ